MTPNNSHWPFHNSSNLNNMSQCMRFPTMWMCHHSDQQRFRSACAYAQSDQSLFSSLEYSMNVKLLTEHHLEFLSLKGGYTGWYESTLVKMPHCRKSCVTAHNNNTAVNIQILSHTVFTFVSSLVTLNQQDFDLLNGYSAVSLFF